MRRPRILPVLSVLALALSSFAACGDDSPEGTGGAGGGASATSSTGDASSTATQSASSGSGGAVTEDEIAAYCQNLEPCWDDAEPCVDSVGLNDAACSVEGRALADCVLDNGTVTVCEGDGIPCPEQFDAFYDCYDPG